MAAVDSAASTSAGTTVAAPVPDTPSAGSPVAGSPAAAPVAGSPAAAPIAGSPAAAPASPAPAPFLARVDFGNAASESATAFNSAKTAVQAAGVGAFDQTYRQLPLSKLSSPTHTDAERLVFTLKVDPDKQNYLTVKLWGNDTQFGVLRMADGEGVALQLDNNISNRAGNPPFYGRFHYATTALPIAQTRGKTSFTVTLFSEGYSYDAGRVGQPTRPVYSAFTHVDPYFVPPAADKTGTAPVQVGAEPPKMIDKATVFRVLKRSRGDIYNLDGVPDGFWNPGGSLANHGSVIPANTPGAPREVWGMHMSDGPLKQSEIDRINALPNAADVWRSQVVGRQTGAIALITSIYLTPPLKDAAGNTVPGYDRYLDPAILDRLIDLLDGQSRSQSGGPNGLTGFGESSCTVAVWDGHPGWGGVTSTPRTSGPWAGSKTRQNAGACTLFSSDQFNTIGRSVLRLLDNPQAAADFKAKLAERIDADLDGKLITRAAMYQRMFAPSVGSLGFHPKALTSDNLFDKFGGTVSQSMIWVGETYIGQLALRNLLALYPSTDADKQPMDPATLKTIVRQLLGLDDMKYMSPATPGFRVITKGGIAETYGTLASGYDGRYGGGVPSDIVKFSMLMKYDPSMSASEREEVAAMARRAIAGFDNFLYPQHAISTAKDGTVTDTYVLGQEDVISWRVPYGPNANSWYLNLQTLAVDPNGVVKSPEARRSLLIHANRGGVNSIISDMQNYVENENAWLSIAGVDPETVPKLSGEPGAADFVWADNDSGAFAMAYQGERLFLNANYNRDKGKVNNYVRLHQVTDTIDRAATVRMPFDASTQQSDGNLSGDFNSAWVVRYGRYLVVMNRSKTAYVAKMPPGTGNANKLHLGGTVAMGGTSSVAAGEYEVFAMP